MSKRHDQSPTYTEDRMTPPPLENGDTVPASTSAPELPEPAKPRQRHVRSKSPELLAMADIDATLDEIQTELGAEAVERVLTWAAAQHGYRLETQEASNAP